MRSVRRQHGQPTLTPHPRGVDSGASWDILWVSAGMTDDAATTWRQHGLVLDEHEAGSEPARRVKG